jgi:hypothetical protein
VTFLFYVTGNVMCACYLLYLANVKWLLHFMTFVNILSFRLLFHNLGTRCFLADGVFNFLK